MELCYYNDLADRFQDSNREWVKVTHWTQVPNMPVYNITEISREEMNLKIEVGEFKLVIYKRNEYDERENKELSDSLFKISKNFALSGISYDVPAFYSTITENGVEDYMYAIKNK